MPMLFHVFGKIFGGGAGYKVRKRIFLKENRNISLTQILFNSLKMECKNTEL